MEYKYISSKFTLQTQTKYKNTKIQTCLHGFLPWYISFQSSVKKKNFYNAKVSHCQNSDIREVSIALI